MKKLYFDNYSIAGHGPQHEPAQSVPGQVASVALNRVVPSAAMAFVIATVITLLPVVSPALADQAVARAYIARAKSLYEKGKFLNSLKLTMEALKISPESAEAKKFFARLESERGRFSEEYTRKGKLLFKDHEYEKARAMFEEALKYDSGNAEAEKYLKDSIETFKKILIWSGFSPTGGAGSGGGARGSGQNLKFNPENQQVITHYRLALEYLRSNQYEAAIREFEAVLRLDPENPGARNQLEKLKVNKKTYLPYQNGVKYFTSGKFDAAMAELAPIYKWNSSFLDVKFYVGALYFHRGSSRQSLEILNDFVSNKHNRDLSPLAHLYIGCSYYKLGIYERALYELTVARTLDATFFNMFNPTSQGAMAQKYYRFAYLMTFRWALIMLGVQLAMAISMQWAIGKVFSLTSGRLVPKLLAKAKKLQKINKLDKALKLLVQAANLEPGDSKIFFSMGVINNKLHKISDAIDCFDIVARLAPDTLKAHYNLAILYNKSGLYKDALLCLQRALDIDTKVLGQNVSLNEILTNKILYEQVYFKYLYLLEEKLKAQGLDSVS